VVVRKAGCICIDKLPAGYDKAGAAVAWSLDHAATVFAKVNRQQFRTKTPFRHKYSVEAVEAQPLTYYSF
jgi:hypothetical protein